MVCDGTHQVVDDDVFDATVQALNAKTPTSIPKAKMTRIPTENTQKKHWMKTISDTHLTCPDCGKKISSKSNLSKQRNTRNWKKNDSASRC